MSKAVQYILTLQDARGMGHSLEQILEAVSKSLKVGRLDLFSHHRLPHLVEARQMFYWFARVYTARSYPEIGRFLKRDHCTVMHGVRKIENRKAAFWPKIRTIANELGVDLYEREAA